MELALPSTGRPRRHRADIHLDDRRMNLGAAALAASLGAHEDLPVRRDLYVVGRVAIALCIVRFGDADAH
jgi:hypothetical protein